MHTVFVSHSHQENDYCDAFVEALRAHGVDAWYDRSSLQAGHFLSDDIQRELEARTIFILLASPAAIDSYWIRTELGAFRELAARDPSRIIIPVRIAPVELPLLLRAYMWIDAVDVPLEDVMDQLASTIGFPTRAQVAAAERRRQAAVDAERRRQVAEERRAERQQVALELERARAARRTRLSADLLTVGLLTLEMLLVASLLLSLVFPVLPRTVGLETGVLALLLAAFLSLIKPLRRGIARAWHDARKGLATVVSLLLTLAVVATALFVTKPTTLVSSTPTQPSYPFGGYNYNYTYHPPTGHQGEAATIGLWCPDETLAPGGLGTGDPATDPCLGLYFGLWQGCLTQLPNLSLRSAGWKADQCTEVPTAANGLESADGIRTTFHIDPKAVWSDGMPITADDFVSPRSCMPIQPSITLARAPLTR
jgi:hypothetical protein